jgi:S1-C subfamily serine protease
VQRLTLLLAAAVVAAAVAGRAAALDPATFADDSTGVVLVRATCAHGTVLGTGFLVGAGVVMTARHVVKGCLHTRVHTTAGRWIDVTAIQPWEDPDSTDIDVATLRLAQPSDGHVFSFRPSQIQVGAEVATIGHPLGTDIALTQGKVVDRSGRRIFVHLLGGEGASGSPILDAEGRVVGILQTAYGGRDATGQVTSGLLSGYDFSSHWAGWRRALCKTYRTAAIADCPS